jgi:hypothetical protein
MTTALAFRVVGSASNRREICDYKESWRLYAAADPAIQPDLPAYLSAFSYPEKLRELVERTGSTAGYSGPVGIPKLHFDIDRPDLATALIDTRRLVHFLADRYGVDPLVHFSGSKGFHVSLPMGSLEPDPDNHQIAKALACRLADEIGVTIDTGVYSPVQLWRAPNSRHHKTGLHKVRIDPDDLLYLNCGQIRQMAAGPIPYDVKPTRSLARVANDWNEVQAAIHRAPQCVHGGSNGGNGESRGRINPLTRLLLTDPTAIQVGERHRVILSAAADLSEFPTVPDLVKAILRQPALDTGLPPREVDRQIHCGVEMATRQARAQGGAV